MVLLGLAAAACIPSTDVDCSDPAVTIDATVTDSAMEPAAISACRGQDVTLVLTSETDGVLHIHVYDDQVPATPLTPGEDQTLAFTDDHAGQFIIELHARSGQEETEIGVLTINEP